jgi:Mrp family chromosome partitioning ATPase
MTSFDKAFIKAFDHPHTAREQAVAPPHAGPERSARTRLGGSPARASEMGVHTPSELRPSAPPRPLSSFTARPKLQDSWRALLEVDRLPWPAVCEQLLTSARIDWDRWTDLIVDRMAHGQKCIGIGGSERNAGRTSVTLTLARQLAVRGMRLVLVDADFEQPMLADTCGISVHTGWDDLLASELALGESLIAAVEDGVTLMPWRTGTPEAALPLSGKIPSIFATLREHYDITLVDLLPLTGKPSIGDFAQLATAMHLDAMYMVRNLANPSAESLAGVCSKLRRAGVPVTGTIENFARHETSRTATAVFPFGGRWQAARG